MQNDSASIHPTWLTRIPKEIPSEKRSALFCRYPAEPALYAGAGSQQHVRWLEPWSDPSGSAISDGQVVAVEANTKVKSTVRTNDQGYYSVTFILPGTYDITVTRDGFKKLTKTGVVVPVNQAVRTDFSLQIGSTESTVTVTADTPPLRPMMRHWEKLLHSERWKILPVSGHNAMDVSTMSSNVYVGSGTSYQGNPPGEEIVGAGQRGINNSISLDGVLVMNDLITTTPAHPADDMISQVQMQSGNYPAQYGGYLGVHINMVTKNGTNDLHGSAYDYVENTAFNAYPFVAKAGSAKPVLHLNQFGGTVGGPVYFPKLYNGRNKTFFFGSFEKLNQIGQGSGNCSSVLTPAMESGDFSALGGYVGGTCTGQCTVGPLHRQLLSQQSDPVCGIEYASGLDREEVRSVYGCAESSGISSNLNTSFPSNLVIKQSIDRVDENIGQNIKLFVRYYFENLTFLSGTAFPANASNGPTNQRNYAFGYTHILTPTLVNDLHVGINKLIAENLNYWYTAGLKDAGTKLGIPGFTGDTQYGNPGVPVVAISNFQGVGNAGSNWFQDDRGYDLYDQLSYIHGKHQFMVGFQLHRLTLGREATNNPVGIINFTASKVTVGVPGVSTGYSAADFVLGYVNNDTTPIDTIKGSVKGVARWLFCSG